MLLWKISLKSILNRAISRDTGILLRVNFENSFPKKPHEVNLKRPVTNVSVQLRTFFAVSPQQSFKERKIIRYLAEAKTDETKI